MLELASQFLLSKNEVTSWPGTELSAGHHATRYLYDLNAESVALLVGEFNGLRDFGPDEDTWSSCNSLPDDFSLWIDDHRVFLASTSHEYDAWLEVTEDKFVELAQADSFWLLLRKKTLSAYDFAFLGAMFWNFKELAPLLRDRLDDWWPAPIPHLLMTDVTKWLLKKYEDSPSDPLLIDILEFISDAWQRADADEKFLIRASFLQKLPSESEPGADILSLLSAELNAAVLNG